MSESKTDNVPVSPAVGVTFSVAAEQRLRDMVERAVEFCHFCISHGGPDVRRQAQKTLKELQG